ncbi:virulence factor MviN, partial [Nocardiopsis flavescens]
AIAVLGGSATLGLTCAALAFAAAVRRVHGAPALAGAGRTAAAVAAGGVLGWAAGRPVAGALAGGGVWPSVGAALVSGALAVVVFALVAAAVDRSAARAALDRVRSVFERRRGSR